MTLSDDFDLPSDEELTPAPRPGSYQSPLMARASANRLTVALLQEEIPKIRAGEDAQARIEAGEETTSEERRALNQAYREGQRAKERLFAAALPLIRTIALREYRRRQQWNSRVPLDDLMQEAIVGFFKGLAGFKTESIRKSATNYLGQWMLVEMRRSAEVMDHDLQVGHDAGERFRRVRALRSRLLADLGREPTDEEISEASRNPAYVTRPGMVGKAPEEGEAVKVGKGLTVAQVAEERNSRNRVGSVVRMTSGEDSESGGVGAGFVDSERLAPSEDNPGISIDPAELAAEQQTNVVIAALVARVIVEMELPVIQTEIISRRYGLAPHTEESSARAIARDMGIHRERVSRVLVAFADEMTEPGGPFHQVVSELSMDDLQAIGLGWLSDTLGPWDPAVAAKHQVSAVLTEELSTPAPTAASRAVGSTSMDGVLAWFSCAADDNVFSGLYPDSRSVPQSRPCPQCGELALRIDPDDLGGS